MTLADIRFVALVVAVAEASGWGAVLGEETQGHEWLSKMSPGP